MSASAIVNHNSLYNYFSLSHFTSLKCHKKSILLHQVRACNHFVWRACFNGKAMCVSVCKLKETDAGLNSAELCSSVWRILWGIHTQCNLYSTRIFCLPKYIFPLFRGCESQRLHITMQTVHSCLVMPLLKLWLLLVNPQNNVLFQFSMR